MHTKLIDNKIAIHKIGNVSGIERYNSRYFVYLRSFKLKNRSRLFCKAPHLQRAECSFDVPSLNCILHPIRFMPQVSFNELPISCS